jgi:hypothetical protein
MKRSAIAIAAVAALLLTGCAADMGRYYEVQAKAIEADNNAVMALAAAAAGGHDGAIMALALRKSAAGQIAVPQDKALAWASVLLPTGASLAQGYWGKQIQERSIEADTARYGMTLGTLGVMAGQGIDAAAKPPVIIGPSEGLRTLYPSD